MTVKTTVKCNATQVMVALGHRLDLVDQRRFGPLTPQSWNQEADLTLRIPSPRCRCLCEHITNVYVYVYEHVYVYIHTYIHTKTHEYLEFFTRQTRDKWKDNQSKVSV